MHCYRIPLANGVLNLLGPAQPDALLDDPETERRYHAEDEYMPYWARPWAASMMLAEFVLRAYRNVRERRALEVGCGLGLVGLAAAMAGWRVMLSDYEEAALAFACESAQHNGLKGLEFIRCDWRRMLMPEGPIAPDAFDLVLAADVLFESRWVHPIAELSAAFVASGATVLICDPNRRTAEGFPWALKDRRLEFSPVPVTCTDLDGKPAEGTIYQIRPTTAAPTPT